MAAHSEDPVPLLRDSALLGGLIDEDYELLAQGARVRTYAADAALFYEHDEAGSAYLIVEGSVSIERNAESWRGDGETVQIAQRGPGDLIGELSLFDDLPRNADARALEPTTAIQLRGKQVLLCAQQSPELAYNLLCHLANKLREATDRQTESRVANVRGRVMRALAEEGRLHGTEEPAGTRILLDAPGRRITQQELALRAVCDRAVLNRTLSALLAEGVIEKDPSSILVRRIPRGQAVAGALLRTARESGARSVSLSQLRAAPRLLGTTPEALRQEIDRLLTAGALKQSGDGVSVANEAALERLALGKSPV